MQQKIKEIQNNSGKPTPHKKQKSKTHMTKKSWTIAHKLNDLEAEEFSRTSSIKANTLNQNALNHPQEQKFKSGKKHQKEMDIGA